MDHARDHDIVMEVLSSVQCKVTRIDTTTGIFACPILLYASDGEEVDRPNFQDAQTPITNILDINAVEDLGPAIQPIDPGHESERNADIQVHSGFMIQCDGENPLLRYDEEDEVDLPERISTTHWIEYLWKKGPTIILRALGSNGAARSSMILRKLGGELKVLQPGNDCSEELGDLRDKARWGRYLSALVEEMMTVESRCSSQVRKSGVFVLSTFPYAVLLEFMATELLANLE